LILQGSGGNVCISTSTSNSLSTLYGTSQIPVFTLTDQEFYQGTNTNGDGVALLLRVNRKNK
jgi:hypothetical protein